MSRKWTHRLIAALIVLAPLGTRYIIDVARIGEATVESATHGVFLTQIVALAVVVSVLVGERGRNTGLFHPERFALALFALAAFSAAFSPDPIGSSATVLRLALGVLMFIAVSRSGFPVRAAVLALLVMAVLQAAFGAVQFAVQEVPASTMLGVAAQSPASAGTSVVETADARWLRAYGTLPHPNVLGFAAGAGVLSGVWLAAEVASPVPVLALVAISSVGLFLSFSRGALIAFMLGCAALFADAVRNRRTRIRYLAAAATVGAVAVLSVAVVPDAWLARAGASGRLETASVDERARSLTDAADLIFSEPLFGVGPGLMPFALAARYPYKGAWTHQPAHSVPLLIGAEAGIPAMLVWLLFVSALFAVALRTRARGDVAPLFALLIAIVAASLVDHYFWSTWPGQLMFWTFTGLVWGRLRRAYAPDPAIHSPSA